MENNELIQEEAKDWAQGGRMDLAVIITNIILTIAIVIVVVALLANMAKDSRPIVIKEAKALREYYESKLKVMEEKTDKAEEERIRYKSLYESELQKNGDASSLRSEKIRLEAQFKRLAEDLNSCEDRINEMAQENASLKEQIKALKKTTSNKPTRKGK